MPRNMSFQLTTDQFRNRTKTVTRRVGWWFLKPGDLLMGCEKCQGLQKEENINRLGLIRVVEVCREPLAVIATYGPEELEREGFPDMSPIEFIEMFVRTHKGCSPSTNVNRIEFEYVD